MSCDQKLLNTSRQSLEQRYNKLAKKTNSSYTNLSHFCCYHTDISLFVTDCVNQHLLFGMFSEAVLRLTKRWRKLPPTCTVGKKQEPSTYPLFHKQKYKRLTAPICLAENFCNSFINIWKSQRKERKSIQRLTITSWPNNHFVLPTLGKNSFFLSKPSQPRLDLCTLPSPASQSSPCSFFVTVPNTSSLLSLKAAKRSKPKKYTSLSDPLSQLCCFKSAERSGTPSTLNQEKMYTTLRLLLALSQCHSVIQASTEPWRKHNSLRPRGKEGKKKKKKENHLKTKSQRSDLTRIYHSITTGPPHRWGRGRPPPLLPLPPPPSPPRAQPPPTPSPPQAVHSWRPPSSWRRSAWARSWSAPCRRDGRAWCGSWGSPAGWRRRRSSGSGGVSPRCASSDGCWGRSSGWRPSCICHTQTVALLWTDGRPCVRHYYLNTEHQFLLLCFTKSHQQNSLPWTVLVQNLEWAIRNQEVVATYWNSSKSILKFARKRTQKFFYVSYNCDLERRSSKLISKCRT